MIYPSCIHTHTEFCDGKSTMREICRRAEELGFESLGFSPHSPLPYANDWAATEESFEAFLAQEQKLKKEYEGRLELYAGIELDSETAVCPEGLDYVIGAVHTLVKSGERFAVDYEKDLLRDVTDRLYGGDFLSLAEEYFEKTAEAALRPQVDVIAHFDLVVKYNGKGEFINESDPRYLEAACAAAKRILKERDDLFFEVNTGGMARAGRPFPYPAPPILRYLHEHGARFIVTCDCHRAHLLGAGYDEALRLLSALCGARVYVFRRGGFQRFSL